VVAHADAGRHRERRRAAGRRGLEDLVYFVVRRVVNSVTRRFIEKLSLRDNCLGGAINQQLDCHAVHQGAAVSSIALPWLPNTLLTVWADGASIGSGMRRHDDV
jgi:hypothetical protein